MAPIGKVDGTDWKGGWHRLEKGFSVWLVQVRILGELLDASDPMPLQISSQLQGPTPHQPFVFEDHLWDRRRYEPFRISDFLLQDPFLPPEASHYQSAATWRACYQSPQSFCLSREEQSQTVASIGRGRIVVDGHHRAVQWSAQVNPIWRLAGTLAPLRQLAPKFAQIRGNRSIQCQAYRASFTIFRNQAHGPR